MGGCRQWRPLYWRPFVRSVVPQDDLAAVGPADHQVGVELGETRRHHRRLKHTTKYMKIQVKLSTTDCSFYQQTLPTNFRNYFLLQKIYIQITGIKLNTSVEACSLWSQSLIWDQLIGTTHLVLEDVLGYCSLVLDRPTWYWKMYSGTVLLYLIDPPGTGRCTPALLSCT